MDLKERLRGCLVYGAIGDAVGSRYEGLDIVPSVDFDFEWKISDDTQLTMATCEAIFDTKSIDPARVASKFLYWYTEGKLTGLGASTLKALRELQMGGHWTQVARSGEYAAGNGAAMRIAPLAFKNDVDRFTIADVCKITHKNDEAYTGALAVYYAIKHTIEGKWKGADDLIENIIDELSDTRVRDRCIELEGYKHQSIAEVGLRYKPTGYVVDSVPIALFAAQQVSKLDYKTILTELIKLGGDTDTTCSMTGQIVGTLLGKQELPKAWQWRYEHLQIDKLIDYLCLNWNA